jgi:hypothetical protein
MSLIKVVFTPLLTVICLVACNNSNKTISEVEKGETITNFKEEDMKSYISLLEIPAMDIPRAINFYQAILSIRIEKMEIPGMEIGIFPYEGQIVPVVIMKSEGSVPSANGVTIYLNAGDNLQSILDKVEKNGGKILLQKTAHADESGYFALFLDSEGNKMGLNSPN